MYFWIIKLIYLKFAYESFIAISSLNMNFELLKQPNELD